MDVLSYSPSVKAYVRRVREGGASDVLDVSDDVASCTVKRNMDAASSFSMTLSNDGGKYDDAFMPFDAIKIAAVKDGDVEVVFTGYITEDSKFRLFNGDIELSGKDVLYRLQQLYFDPQLAESRRILGVGFAGWNFDKRLECLLAISGMSRDMVRIGKIPDDVVETATQMYVAQAGDYERLEKIRSDIEKMVQGMQFSGTSSGYELPPLPTGEWQTCDATSYGHTAGDDNGIAGWTCEPYGTDGLGVAIPMYPGIGITKDNPYLPGFRYGMIVQLMDDTQTRRVNCIANDCGNFGPGNTYNHTAYFDLQPGVQVALWGQTGGTHKIYYQILGYWTSDPTHGKGPYSATMPE